MNAKKIMGAVLVALLAAALFVGAGAAATVFVYEPVDPVTYSGTWVNGVNSVTFEPVTVNDVTGKVAIMGENIVEGEYTQVDGNGDTQSIIVKYPTAVISGIATATGTSVKYPFIGGNLYEDDTVSITNETGSTIKAAGYILTVDDVEKIYTADEIKTEIEKLDVGTYKIQVYFDAAKFADGTPANYLNGAVYTFTVVEADDVTVTLSADSILPEGIVKATIVAKPGTEFTLGEKTDFTVVDKQQNVEYNTPVTITVPNTGKVTVALQATAAATGDETITFAPKTGDAVEVDITIEKGSITAKADAASYFVGDKITITGTNTAGAISGYTLKGTNFEADEVKVEFKEGTTVKSKTFEFEIDTSKILDGKKKLDVGTYTLTILVGDLKEPSAKATVALVLKQPFITIIEAPEVIVQGTEAKFVIGAEATGEIAWYLFGTNYFNATNNVVSGPEKDTTNQFKFTLDDKFTENMDAGQYFMVIQHPMYDGAFNILAFNNAFYLNTTGTATDKEGFLFNVDIRQTANAAQALCDALDTQNIDDMYVKYSFFVVGEDESFIISDIPTTIAQGDTLTISGVSTSNAEEYVTVEMISTAFAAVPKETVGSASFIAVTTQIAEDGTWEVTFDTSNLNVDEYSLKVACGEDTWKNVNINVVEAADEPDTPVTPPADDEPGQDEPVAPETPGFGALAALAGLGAVAVLLLRRE